MDSEYENRGSTIVAGNAAGMFQIAFFKFFILLSGLGKASYTLNSVKSKLGKVRAFAFLLLLLFQSSDGQH